MSCVGDMEIYKLNFTFMAWYMSERTYFYVGLIKIYLVECNLLMIDFMEALGFLTELRPGTFELSCFRITVCSNDNPYW